MNITYYILHSGYCRLIKGNDSDHVKLMLKTSFLEPRSVNEHADICDAELGVRETPTADDVVKELSEIIRKKNTGKATGT